MRKVLTIAGLVSAIGLAGCQNSNPATTQPGGVTTQPSNINGQQILDAVNGVYQFNKALLTELHTSAVIPDATWNSDYLPAMAAADMAFAAAQAQLNTPGSIEAQAKFAAAAAQIAILVIKHIKSNAPAVQNAALKLQTPHR